MGKANAKLRRQTDYVDYQLRLEKIVKYWFSTEEIPDVPIEFDRDTELPKKWLASRIDPSEEQE